MTTKAPPYRPSRRGCTWAALLLLAMTAGAQARDRHESRLRRSGLNLDRLPWGKEGLRREVDEVNAGLPGSTVVLPPTRPDERATELNPRTVRTEKDRTRPCPAPLCDALAFCLQLSLSSISQPSS
jgi:hypothetical protein